MTYLYGAKLFGAAYKRFLKHDRLVESYHLYKQGYKYAILNKLLLMKIELIKFVTALYVTL